MYNKKRVYSLTLYTDYSILHLLHYPLTPTTFTYSNNYTHTTLTSTSTQQLSHPQPLCQSNPEAQARSTREKKCLRIVIADNVKQMHRTRAESQWIVATKATLPLTIPGSYSSRLHAIYPFCSKLTMWPEAKCVPLHKAVLAPSRTKRSMNRRVLARILT